MDTEAGNSVLSSEQVCAATGRGWQEWAALLDAWETDTKNLVTVSTYLAAQHGLRRFWTQVIAFYYLHYTRGNTSLS
jgi:hypothetical protein